MHLALGLVLLAVAGRPLGLDDVVNNALTSIGGPLSVTVQISPELPEVLADAGLLERVAANVVEHAVRYNPPGRPVLITAGTHDLSSEDGQIELRVIDAGPGIPAQDRDGVFESFQRRDDTAVSTGAGVGLGLAIAQGFVEAMNGSIALEDTPGGGLMVSVALAAAKADRQRELRSTPQSRIQPG